jgi:hypothetical protein
VSDSRSRGRRRGAVLREGNQPVASPESIASTARLIPASRSGTEPATSSAAPALSTTASRRGPRSPSKTVRMIEAFWAGSPPTRRSSGDAGTAPVERLRGSTVYSRTSPSRTSATRFSPTGVSSSSPPAPWTTSAWSAPSRTSTWAIGATSAAS